MRRLSPILLFLLAFPALAQEAYTGRGPDRPTAAASRHMISAANPHAAEAGRAVLRAGGSAVDAAIAAALVLAVVEPQASGLGGGGFLVAFDPGRQRITTLDGRETAPAATRPDRFLDAQGKPLPFRTAVRSGRSVGVPGIPALLTEANARFGRRPWSTLVEPAIRLAEKGFEVSPRLHALLAREANPSPALRAVFYGPDGTPKRVGEKVVQPALAKTLRLFASERRAPFYSGAIARDIVAAVRNAPDPGDMTAEDLAGYEVVERSALCGPYRQYRVCGMGPPSSGGIAVLQMLAMLESQDMATVEPNSAMGVHLLAEAGRLAFADRARYLADPDKTNVPVRGLLEAGYLSRRSELIRLDASMGVASPGEPSQREGRVAPSDPAVRDTGTTHISVVDESGQAVAMTLSIEQAFGSQLMAAGFLLNNELTDFAALPLTEGEPAANAPGPGKRPRSSMAPTLVFAPNGQIRLVVGSAGGARIIGDVAKTIVAVLDWKLDPQAAIQLPNRGSRNGPTDIEAATALEALRSALEALGHEVQPVAFPSGIHAILREPGRLRGGADPRREGVALGD